MSAYCSCLIIVIYSLFKQHMWPLLKVGGGLGTEMDVAVVANVSARVGSIGDNRLGGWHSYRASKTALNQCMVSSLVSLNISSFP